MPRHVPCFSESTGSPRTVAKTLARSGINWKDQTSLLVLCLLVHWRLFFGQHLTSAANWDGSTLAEREDDFTPYHHLFTCP